MLSKDRSSRRRGPQSCGPFLCKTPLLVREMFVNPAIRASGDGTMGLYHLLAICFGRPAGARFVVDSSDAFLWVLGVALIIAGARLSAFFELRRHSRQTAAELSGRMEPRLRK